MSSDVEQPSDVVPAREPVGRPVTSRPVRHRMPLRVEVYSDIVQRIRSGEFPSGRQIPGEYELAETFRVSRTVIREAMILLEEDHWIENRPGNGRFVAATIPVVGLKQLRPLNELLAEQLGGTSSSVLRIIEEPATEFVAGRLGVSIESPTLLAEYVIEDADGRPLAYTLEWVPADLMSRERLAAGFEDSALSTLVASGIRPWRGRLTISATTAGRHRARLLGVSATAAIVLLEATITDANGRAVLVAKHHLRPDVVQISLLQEP